MTRRRTTPWIHRWSRLIIAAIATIGVIETAYLTVIKLSGGAAACPTSGCNEVLNSPFATVFGIPLTIFGFLAYASMGAMAAVPLFINPDTQKALRSHLEKWTWLLMFALGVAMACFSSYLMYLLAFEIKAVCPYCIASALFSASLFILTIVGHEWEDLGQLFLIGTLVFMVTFIGALGIYNTTKAPPTLAGETGAAITTTSGPAEIALARHLKEVDAKMYGAYWCPHCHDQKLLFGKEAFTQAIYIECDPKGKNAQPDLCKAAGIKGFPSWVIKGQLHEGTQSLERLAKLSGYTGPRNFQNTISGPQQR